MFCSKCGKQMKDGSKFCPDCGEAVASAISPDTSKVRVADLDLQQGQGNGMAFDAKADEGILFNSKTEGASRKKWIIFIVAAIAVFVIIVIIGAFSGGSDEEKLISMVQDGYLGNYKTVTLQEVLEFTFPGGEWGAGEAKNGGYYIVEYKGEDDIEPFAFQFSVSEMDADTFRLSGMMVLGNDCSGWSAYTIKTYLDMLYGAYAEAYPNKGIVVDESTSNDTLKGHVR